MASLLKKIIDKKLTDEELYTLYLNRVSNYVENIKVWIYIGHTFTQIADELEISNSMLWRMMRSKNSAYDKLREAMNSDVSDDSFANVVEQSLYRKCTGYDVYETMPIKLKREYYNKKGKKCTEEVIEYCDVKKHIPADFSAQRFYLLNHKRNKYTNENKITENDKSLQELLDGVKNITITIKEKADNKDDSAD